MNNFFDGVHVLFKLFDGAQIISEFGFKPFSESNIGSMWLTLADLCEGLHLSEPLINFLLTILILKLFDTMTAPR